MRGLDGLTFGYGLGFLSAHISTHSWVEAGLAERNCPTNRMRENFATGPV